MDFAETQRHQAAGEWEKAGQLLGDTALSLEKAGAEFIIICTNTMHKVIEFVEEKISIPILHIADTTANEILKSNVRTIGLLGTTYTMEQDFYKSRIESNGIKVLVPNSEDRKVINKIIFEELCLGEILPSSREKYEKIIERLVEEGAEGVILGYTEIGLLVKQQNSQVPLFDTTVIHALEAVKKALE